MRRGSWPIESLWDANCSWVLHQILFLQVSEIQFDILFSIIWWVNFMVWYWLIYSLSCVWWNGLKMFMWKLCQHKYKAESNGYWQFWVGIEISPLIAYAGCPVTKNIACWFSPCWLYCKSLNFRAVRVRCLHYSNYLGLFYEKVYIEVRYLWNLWSS